MVYSFSVPLAAERPRHRPRRRGDFNTRYDSLPPRSGAREWFGDSRSPSAFATSTAAVVRRPVHGQFRVRLPPAVLARRVERGLPHQVGQSANSGPILLPHVVIDLDDLRVQTVRAVSAAARHPVPLTRLG